MRKICTEEIRPLSYLEAEKNVFTLKRRWRKLLSSFATRNINLEFNSTTRDVYQYSNYLMDSNA